MDNRDHSAFRASNILDYWLDWEVFIGIDLVILRMDWSEGLSQGVDGSDRGCQ